MIRTPTEKQLALAKRLGLQTKDVTFRVISALIADELDRRSDDYVKKHGIVSGMKVRYVGKRDDFPEELVVSTYGKNCFLYFKGGSALFCRPMDVIPLR